MYLKIRTTKTASGATAVQAVFRTQGKTQVVKHFGSVHDAKELKALVTQGQSWVNQENKQQSLFNTQEPRVLPLATARLSHAYHTYAREFLLGVAHKIGFDALHSELLVDLALMRIIEPASKLRTLELLERYFGVQYSERTLYRTLKSFALYKEEAERIALTYAKKHHTKDISLVLYDVTTLYFESFKSDELRVPGFSKDSKSQQPQIVVGLLVSRDGFPLGYEVFKGNTFEGHTMLPVFKKFIEKHKVNTPVLVADAAMLSKTNMDELTTQRYSYIVGGRLANLSPKVINQIKREVPKTDGSITRITTERGDLIVAFSSKREKKNRHEMEKQIKKAKALIEKGEVGRRAKFVVSQNAQPTLNTALQEKTETLLGMKGYYTNIPETILSNTDVITRYGDLWNVEASFRMSKSDLATRPIFHYTEDAVRAHMVVSFIALAMGRCIEKLFGASLRRFRDAAWDVVDAHITDMAADDTFILRSEIPEYLRVFELKIKKWRTY